MAPLHAEYGCDSGENCGGIESDAKVPTQTITTTNPHKVNLSKKNKSNPKDRGSACGSDVRQASTQ